jgi:hypothetical protein
MSWGDMVNNNLVGSGNVSKAAICGLDGAIWGKSDNFKVRSADILSIMLRECVALSPTALFPTQSNVLDMLR